MWIYYTGVLVSAFGGGLLGWGAHREWCMRTHKNCDVWQEDARIRWTAELRKGFPRRREHRPTPVDSTARTGVPSRLAGENSAVTKPANPARRTTP